jgi:phosphoribosylformylglycinamidine synthase PurS subunit
MSVATKTAPAGTLFLIEVFISPRPVVNDPQGLAVREGLHQLGYDEVESVRVGKYLRLHVRAADAASAHARAVAMCDQLLANPIIEDYRLAVTELGPGKD